MDISSVLVHSLIFFQTQITFAQTPIECQNCGCCVGNWNKCSVHNEKCKYGCLNGYFGEKCQNKCKYNNCERCVGNDGSNCLECKKGFYSTNCEQTCPEGCDGNACEKMYGVCTSCIQGYYGDHCNISCLKSCQECDQHGQCSECKPGYLNTDKQCTCRTDICVSTSVGCDSCTNTSYFAIDDECCLCPLENCASCTNQFDTVICKICKSGYFLHANGHCEICNSKCVDNKCDSSSGRCLQGCITGYWTNTCDEECEPECLSCNQADGSCSQCKNKTTYGPNCTLECSTTCKNSVCDFDGNCTNGCVLNMFGKQCESTCNANCTHKDNITRCSETTGMCLHGCHTGYSGRFCPQVFSLVNEAEANKQTAILEWGISGGAVAFVISVAVGLFLLRRRRGNFNSKRKPSEKGTGSSSALLSTVNNGGDSRAEYANEDCDIENPNYQSGPLQNSDNNRTIILTEDNLEIDEDDIFARQITVMFEESGGVYYNNAKEVSKFKLTVADLSEYVNNKHMKDLEEVFQKIPYGLMKPFDVSQTRLNMHRNRYKGIYPYDDTRVKVSGGDTDYINASYVDGFRKRNAYIASLGPMAQQLGNFGQFWRMVWQQKVEKIVMVTKLVEGQKTKCEQYWPDYGQSKIYGELKVVLKVENLYADFIWRQFSFSKDSEERSLHHLQFTSWPDKDIPADVTSIIEFRQRVNALQSTFDGPVIVHCSAGVGRTGTYIALDILTNEGEAEGAIDIPGCVLNMRQNRPSMIQTLSQYMYLHQALVHSLTLDCSLIKTDHFSKYMEKSSKQEIQKQFEKIQHTREQKSDKELNATEMNRLLTKKNRKHADIPGDNDRPRLHQFLKTGESDYINAIYMDSLKTKHRFLVAQTPLPDTAHDFIALAVQENCSCIVSLEAHMEKQKGIGLYFPDDNQPLKTGMFSVRSTRDQSAGHFVKRILHFELEGKTKTDEKIPHYEYLDWDTRHNVPKSAELFVAFIKEVEEVSKPSPLKGPILIHCLNGAGKSGLFCVVSTLLEQVSEDNGVSVVNAVQKVRARRPLAVPNKEQFYFCYECVLHSVNKSDKAVYYNISEDIQRK